MKKIISVLLSVVMLVAASALTTTAFAAEVQSYETTSSTNKIDVEVNGKTSTDVIYEKDPDDPTKIIFIYTGDGELEGWEFPGMQEGVHYQIISEDGNTITIEIINGFEGDIVANAIVKNPKKKGTKKNKSSKSPKTGVASATGLAAAGAGAAILIALRKKDDAE